MLALLPAPVLSLRTDVVADVDSQQALAALLTLSLRSGNSIHQGARLENIAERLWHRTSSTSMNYRPPTPASEPSISHSESGTQVPHRSSIAYSFSKPTHINRECVRNKQDVRLGRVILDILSQDFSAHDSSLKGALLAWMLESQFNSLPTPSSEPAEVDTLPNTQAVSNASPSRCRVVPSVCLPSTPPHSKHAGTCPQLVVVNPTPNLTPNPTPHPTPPATPVLASEPSFVQHQPAHLGPASLQFNSALVTTLSSSATPRAASNPQTPLSSSATVSQSQYFPQQEVVESPKPQELSFQPPTSPVTSPTGNSDGGSSAFSKPSLPTQALKSSETRRPSRGVRKNKGLVPRRTKALSRRAATADNVKARPTFNIGSTSSNGSKLTETSKSASKGSATDMRLSLPPPPEHDVPPPQTMFRPSIISALPAVVKPNGCRIELASTSSDCYDTEEDAGNDSWASEDLSVEDAALAQEESRLRAAAEEALRQRNMFKKVPVPSQPTLARTQSGLLSQLMNPDPARFPPNHPYRIQSSVDLTQISRVGTKPRPPLTLQKSKSSAAVPLAASIIVSPTVSGRLKASKSPVFPLRKPPPPNVEMEDETDSGEDNQVGSTPDLRSVAEEKLAKLIGKRNMPSQVMAKPHLPPVAAQPSEPIPLGHPYNLPINAAPSTPRTTRRQMLSTELSESLRRQLLWQRQVDRTILAGPKSKIGRTIAPVTATTSVVQVTARTGDRRATTNGQEFPGDPRQRRSQVARHRSWVLDDQPSHW